MYIDFSKLERKVFEFMCELARNITVSILEQLDERLMNERDKKRYRMKDKNITTIKTIYGNVEYARRYYFDNEKGEYIYLLDEEMKMNRVGLFSENMANLIIKECINEPYNKAAASVSAATGNYISSVGAWKLVQEVGRNIEADENLNIQDMDRGINKGAKQTSVLFQETDGVYLKMQGKDRKKSGAEASEGVEYRNMGVQENQNCTLLTMRMKHRRMTWSVAGANNLAKVICANENGELDKYIENTYEFKIPLGFIEVDRKDIASNTRIPKIIGKDNNIYAELINSTVPAYTGASTTSKILRSIMNGGYN